MNFQLASACVLGREAMRRLDQQTIAAGTPSLELMERAGQALADAVADSAFHGVLLPARPRLLVLAGRGNNGGDGFVVARLLSERGWHCVVALVDGPPADGGDAARNLDRWTRMDGQVWDAALAQQQLELRAPDFDLCLDAIFGTGLQRPVEGSTSVLIETLNKSGLPAVSADISSGLCSDTGAPLGVAVAARATVAIGAAKPGQFLGQGPNYSGRVEVAEIGLLPPTSREGVVLTETSVLGAWPRLPQLAHKGTRGHVLVVAGSRGKAGAAVLAARAALRAGAGLVTVAGVADVQAAVSAALPEAMTRLLPADTDGLISSEALGELLAAAEVATTIVVGPGLGVGAGTDAVVEHLLGCHAHLVVDADGLNVVAAWSAEQRARVFGQRAASGWSAPILTPHPGEMGRLMATDSITVQQSRKIVANKLSKELGSVVLLKGAATVVSDGMTTAFNLSGNPGMACAGMGDVLSGVCGAVLARLGNPFRAACLSAFVHGAAADLLAGETGPGFLASEVADALPAVLASCLPR